LEKINRNERKRGKKHEEIKGVMIKKEERATKVEFYSSIVT
jgi:hypothetical protein